MRVIFVNTKFQIGTFYVGNIKIQPRTGKPRSSHFHLKFHCIKTKKRKRKAKGHFYLEEKEEG